MQGKRLAVLSVFAAATVFAQSASAQAPQYTIVDLGRPAGNNVSHGTGISSGGEYVVGRGVVGSNKAFVWTQTGGRVDLPGYGTLANSWATGANDSGLVVGMSASSPSVDSNMLYYTSSPVPVVWKSGVATALASSGRVLGVNNSGLAVGSIGAAGTPSEMAVIYNTNPAEPTYSAITATTSDGIGMKLALGINDGGLVYGTGTFNGASVPLTYDSLTGTMTRVASADGSVSPYSVRGVNAAGVLAASVGSDLSAMPYTWSAAAGLNPVALPAGMVSGWARGVNDAGWVVGYAKNGVDSGQHPFLDIAGTSYLLSDLIGSTAGWGFGTNSSTSIGGIGNDGTIVGYAVNTLDGGRVHAFALVPTPVPEPATYGLMLLGLLGVAGLARRRSASR